ncbi:uncharacterized protein LOC119077474 [Bradysia coprophila]|uniref:uncharacterized protein LOC119077474 n=1 Tax=Bradysia coprophila TaxID=38358 RepID=UPI00187D78E7|nr:uncharacterized protein LOC119077474 [Bradysia coprophila]XP_037040577.1 uncharacterized protein LOC119077474 [Bradysia coprophila]
MQSIVAHEKTLARRRPSNGLRLFDSIKMIQPSGNAVIDEAYRLVKEGEGRIVFDEDFPRAVLVVGNTGVGKSTCVVFVASDYSRMYAEKYPPKIGQLVILDEDGKISKPGESTESKTLYPELFINTTRETAYYDLPGFKENRGTAIAIATSYLTRLVFERCSEIKVLLCVDYNSAVGMDRDGFIDALCNLGELIKDTSKFKDAFAMVSTKTPNIPDDDGTIVSDEDVMGGIVHILENDVTRGLKNRLDVETNPDAIKVLENAQFIVEALVTKKSGKFTRVGLLRNPEKEGPLVSGSPLMIATRPTIINAVNDSSYVPVSRTDLGYTLAESTQLEMLQLAKEIDDEIEYELNKIAADIETTIWTSVKAAVDWKLLKDYLNTLQESVQEISEAMKSLKRIDQNAIECFRDRLSKANVSVHVDELSKHVDYMIFLENMLERDDIQNVPKLAFEDIAKLSSGVHAWFVLMFRVYDALSQYQIQQSPELYNVADINDWGMPKSPQGLKITSANIDQFLENLNLDKTAVGSLRMDEERMNEINSVVRLCLQQPISKTYKKDVLELSAPFLTMKRIKEEYKKQPKAKVLSASCTCGLFIDEELEAPGLHLLLLSPTWNVTGNFTIDLSGNKGESYDGPADEGHGETEGKPGSPGKPGQPAGHFVGIADRVVGGERLLLHANGGDGGNGQSGGKGGPGTAGVDPRLPTDYFDRPSTRYNLDDYKTTLISPTFPLLVFQREEWYTIFGIDKATNGSRGGNGGVGGFPNTAGTITLDFYGQASGCPTLTHTDGKIGKIGSGGRGGDAAKHANDRKAYRWYNYIMTEDAKTAGGWEHRSWVVTGYSDSGDSGTDGVNNEGQKQPDKQTSVSELTPQLNNYKEILLLFSNENPLRRNDLLNFFQNITESRQMQNYMYNTYGFLHELTTLEAQFYKLYQHLNSSKYYNSLLKRIDAYGEANRLSGANVERLALSTVYTACLSKLCALDFQYKSKSLIVDLETFMTESLKKIEAIVVDDRKLSAIEIRDEYISEIELKVQEGLELMEKKVEPAIKKATGNMNNALEKLVDEIVDLIEEGEESLQELIQARDKMRQNLYARAFLGVFDFIGKACGFLGPVGQGVGAVISGGVAIGGALVVDPDVDYGDKVLLPPGVLNGLEGLTKVLLQIRKAEIEKLAAQLELCQNGLNDNPNEKADLKEIDIKTRELLPKLEEEQNNEIPADDVEGLQKSTQTVTKLEEELQDEIKKKEKALEEEIAAGDKKKEKALSVVKKIKTGITLVQSSIGLYNQVKGDKKKVDAMTAAIEDLDAEIVALMFYQKAVYSILFPVIREIQKNVEAVQESLPTQSQIALDVTKWEVQTSLGDVQKLLNQSMEGFNAVEDLNACFEQLSEALSLQIHIFDRLENLRSQQALGDYIYNIGNAGDYLYLLKGTKYEELVLQLNVTILSNLVLLEFDNAMHVFKQWIFPFAECHFAKFYLPNSLKPTIDDQSLQELVVTANTQLKAAISTIKTYWSTVTSHDKFFFEGKFYSNEKIGGPFYEWTNSSHRTTIQKLFGKESVTLLADVRNSSTYVRVREAIKFSVIYIKFNLANANEERLAKFKDALEYFMVHLEHSGNSYYGFEGNYYVIPGDKVTLSYSLKGSFEGDPDIQSVSRGKIMTGDLLLSPYALWTVRLITDRDEGWTKIAEFVSDISLELAGQGKYIWDYDNELTKLNLEPGQYYTILN